MEPQLKKNFELMERNKLLTWQMLEAVEADFFHWKPNQSTWSLAQVLEHVVFSESSALDYCKKKMLAGDQMPDATLLNTIKIRLYFWALQSRLKFKAPKPISNPNNNRTLAEMKSYWDQTRQEYACFLEEYPDRYLSKAVFRHPLAGRIKLSEMLYFLNTHITHHQFQINRIIDSFGQLA